MKQLKNEHEITLICEKRGHQTEDDVREVKKICTDVITVPRKPQWSSSTILKTGFSLTPFLVMGHTSNEMRRKVSQEIEKKKYDLIHIETFYVAQNVPKTTIPMLLVEHNIEYLIYKRFADRAPLFLRPLLLIDVMKLKKKEKQIWDQVTKLVAVSEDERKLMEKQDAVVIPNGVDIKKFHFKTPNKKEYKSIARGVALPEKELLFIGDFRWVQNRDTAQWIIQDIWPYLLRAVEGEIKIKLRIVGRSIPEYLKKSSIYDSVLFDEDTSRDTVAIFQQADLLLSPIRIGGGTSYKILEAMATGIPVVTTTLGKEGIEVEADREIIVADDVQSIVEKTAHILRDTDAYQDMVQRARKVIEGKYNWEIIAEKLDMVYKSLLTP